MLDADACIELDPATAPVSQLPVRASTVELTNDNDDPCKQPRRKWGLRGGRDHVPGEQRGIRGRGRERRRCGGGMEQRRATGGRGSCRDKHEANGSVQTPQAPASWQAGTDSASSPSF